MEQEDSTYILRRLLGAASKRTDDGAYCPSPRTLELATSSKTDFDGLSDGTESRCEQTANRAPGPAVGETYTGHVNIRLALSRNYNHEDGIKCRIGLASTSKSEV